MKREEKSKILKSKDIIEEIQISDTIAYPEVKYESDGRIITDPLGSWTGIPLNPYDTPIQDADDL